MGVWGSASVSAENKSTSAKSNESLYGSRTPNVSDQYTAGYNKLLSSMGGNGANRDQQNAIDYSRSQMNPATNPVNLATTGANANLDQSRGWLGDQSSKYAQFESQPARQANAFTANGATSAGVNMGPAASAGGYTGADYAGQYNQLFGSQVTNPALNAFDYGAERNLAALDARTAAAGGFANSRSSEIPYSDMAAQNALGRAQLSSQLNSQGLNSALGFASQDAGRLTQNNQFNTDESNRQALAMAQLQQNNNQFNAGQTQSINQFNAGQNQNTSQFNVNAGYAGDQQNMNAIKARSDTILQHAGLSQQQLSNIVTANGINTSAAQALFEQGTISQSQLQSILDAASAYNGYSFDQNTNTTGSSNTTTVGAKAGFG